MLTLAFPVYIVFIMAIFFFLTYAADDDFKLIVGLGVGFSLFFLTVLVVILIVVYIRIQRRKKEGSLSSDDNSEWVLLVLQLFVTHS